MRNEKNKSIPNFQGHEWVATLQFSVEPWTTQVGLKVDACVLRINAANPLKQVQMHQTQM